jgi:hypothetical protein
VIYRERHGPPLRLSDDRLAKGAQLYPGPASRYTGARERVGSS